jgi:hypothetical protein
MTRQAICRIHDPDDVVPGRICGRPLPCREHSVGPPDRVTLFWCPSCKACPAMAHPYSPIAMCRDCGAKLARVRYQLAQRRGSQ